MIWYFKLILYIPKHNWLKYKYKVEYEVTILAWYNCYSIWNIFNIDNILKCQSYQLIFYIYSILKNYKKLFFKPNYKKLLISLIINQNEFYFEKLYLNFLDVSCYFATIKSKQRCQPRQISTLIEGVLNGDISYRTSVTMPFIYLIVRNISREKESILVLHERVPLHLSAPAVEIYSSIDDDRNWFSSILNDSFMHV